MKVPARQYRYPSVKCILERYAEKVELEESARVVHKKSECITLSKDVIKRIRG